MTTAKMDKLRNFLGLKKSVMGMLSMVILVGMGEHMAEQFLPIYLLALGGGTLSIGFLNGMDNLLSALYSFPGGYLSDKLGYKKALLLFNFLSIAGFAIVILFPSWIAVIVGAALFISWTAISLPATMSLINHVLPKGKHTMGVSVHSLVRRIPMALGPVLGGVAISVWGEVTGVRIAFGFALLLALLALFIQQNLISDTPPVRRSAAEKNPLRIYNRMNPALKRLLVSDILIRFCEQIPYAFVVVWCMKTVANPISATQFGLLRTIEMVTAILIYIPVAWMADKTTKKPWVAITFFNFTVFPLILLFTNSFTWMIVAFIVRGLKEFGEPTRKALILDLAPADCKAGMFGLYYLIRDVLVSIAAFGGAFLWDIDPRVNFLVAFGFGLLGTLWFISFGKDALTVEAKKTGA